MTTLAQEPYDVLIGMTLKEANEYVATHHVSGWAQARATYVTDNRNKDIDEERLQVDLDDNGRITQIRD